MGLLWASCCAVGCGQELVLPTRGQAGSSAAGAPADGLTGSSGAPGDGQTKRLPLLDEPASGLGGAAGGEIEERPCTSCGAQTASRGGTSNSGTEKSRGGTASEAAGGETAFGGAGGATAEPEPSAVLLLSEYVEGPKLKALELFALEGGSLERCELLTYFNGKSEPSRIALQGRLADGELHVVCTKTLSEQASGVCDQVANLSFNGDDALAIRCDGALIDVFGEIGVDPGESWGQGATADHVLQRRCEVTAGRAATQPFELDSEWVMLGVEDLTGLGQRGCEVTTPVSTEP